MLFNSFEFIFVFLPITLLLFFSVARRFGNESAIGVLVLCSLFFYSWWNPAYLALLLASMVVNFNIGKRLGRSRNKPLLIAGITFNLGLIAYYKYAGFLVANANAAFDLNWQMDAIILPLAISFFTFQQIAYLVDSHKGITREYAFVHYALFVSFFPQLIAGPIVHHKDMLPQFARDEHFTLNPADVTIGLSIFAIGLFKKTVIADGIAVYANPVFAAADAGQSLDFFTAWGGALAYTFQLYFDFSGYSDMALGLARIFGIVLPLNFYSPYKAANISEFWRRWHMTLSQFLRDYVYIPLGGNRNGPTKRYTNLMTTMLLGGLWHGAGWNFVIWGGLQGLYLCVNHGWQKFAHPGLGSWVQRGSYIFLAWLITMLAVIVGWVFFRAVTLDGALLMLEGMVGLNGISVPSGIMARLGEFSVVLQGLGIAVNNAGGEVFLQTWIWILILSLSVILLPNVQDLFASVQGSLHKWQFESTNSFWPGRKWWVNKQWKPNTRWALLTGAALAFGILTLSQVSEFLYFQF